MGTTAAAPTACTTRQAMSVSMLPARAQPIDAAANTARPSTNSSLWP